MHLLVECATLNNAQSYGDIIVLLQLYIYIEDDCILLQVEKIDK
ncbi:hypothetical protein C7382_106121 [Porphyromonas loveana]|uniref:Uncharacterized protein n=1 Tax=Porphyromonas loveana TaxID=1884669 RepID=A0A2U1FHM2_9PORP|nr:hypothetical protein C7382_106121 [Porphyromonas loveana]